MSRAGDIFSIPETLRSAGVAPKSPPARLIAWASYEHVRRGCALVEIQYLGSPSLFTLFRVEIRNPDVDVNGVDPLYEEAYRQACAGAKIRGYEVERFSRVEFEGGSHA